MREDRDATMHTSPGARLAAGIVSGLIGGILMIGLMIGYAQMTGAGLTTPLKALGGFVYGLEALVVGPQAILAGALIQVGMAIVLGILFALFMSRATSTLGAMCAGIVVAVVIWAAMDLIVLPYENPTMAARITLEPFAYFVAHILLGLGLGMTPAFIRAFSWERRHDSESRDRAHPSAAQTQSI
jgi:hypothetical protein